MRPVVVVSLLVGFLAVLGAYVALTLSGADAAGLVSAVVTLMGVLGLGAHVEQRTRQQNAVIGKIQQQTNGVLDKRIRDGATVAMRQALRDAGFTNVPHPADPID